MTDGPPLASMGIDLVLKTLKLLARKEEWRGSEAWPSEVGLKETMCKTHFISSGASSFHCLPPRAYSFSRGY